MCMKHRSGFMKCSKWVIGRYCLESCHVLCIYENKAVHAKMRFENGLSFQKYTHLIGQCTMQNVILKHKEMNMRH